MLNKKLFILAGYLFSTGLSVVLLCTFLFAYFNNKFVLITINTFNEANVELLVLPVVIFFIFVGLFFYISGLGIRRVSDVKKIS